MPELKIKQYTEYKKCYCSLCYGLRKHTGLRGSMVLNFECTFLFLLLSAVTADSAAGDVHFRCIWNPFRRIRHRVHTGVLEYVSYVNYQLALLKLEDAYTDGGWFRRVLYRALYKWFRHNRKYRRLRNRYADLSDRSEELCRALYRCEAADTLDYDECSRKMGELLKGFAEGYLADHPCQCGEALLSFLGHLGMWIYLIDAYDDFDQDFKDGRFNPLTYFAEGECGRRACLQSGEWMLGLMDTQLQATLQKIELLQYKEIIENIVCLGTRGTAIAIKREREKHECRVDPSGDDAGAV